MRSNVVCCQVKNRISIYFKGIHIFSSGTQLGNENSRVYNEMAIIKIVHSTVKQLQNPPFIFRKELIEHFKEFGNELYSRMKNWSDYSAEAQRLKITSINGQFCLLH